MTLRPILPGAFEIEGEPVARKRPWIPHKPEDRLSIVTSRFLEDALVPPFYVTALADDDEGQRTPQQRMRGHERGQKPGQLDFDVVQGRDGVALARKLELKRGKNDLSEHQKVTFQKLIACNAPPLKAKTLREVYQQLWGSGFRFNGNVETLLQKYEAQLDALDRTAELTLAGASPAKKSRPRKAAPRTTAPKSVTKRWAKAGLRF